MASEAQYEILRSVYQEENDRYTELINRGKIYLTICSFFLGGLAFKLNESFASATWWAKTPYLVSAACFIASFLLIILSLGIYSHEGLCDPNEVIDNFGATPPDDDDFRDDRIADIAVATEINSAINDRRASFLSTAAYSMFSGVVFGFLGLIMIMV